MCLLFFFTDYPSQCATIGYGQPWERVEGGDTTNSILRKLFFFSKLAMAYPALSSGGFVNSLSWLPMRSSFRISVQSTTKTISQPVTIKLFNGQPEVSVLYLR